MVNRVLPPVQEMKSDSSLLGYEMTDGEIELLSVFTEIIMREAKTTNLIGPKESIRLWSRHILESIAYIKMLDISKPVVDVGTGAGFPGVILAICGLSVTLVEPRRKRAEFLIKVKKELSLDSAEIIEKKIETIPAFPKGTQFTGRAVKGREKLIELIEKGRNKDFTLVYRVPDDEYSGKGNVICLPVPPLDRSGILVQYQISGKQIKGNTEK